jgi:diguanylate cyclase (GGDEF)-like protein/PAS domain S-box-containing protein
MRLSSTIAWTTSVIPHMLSKAHHLQKEIPSGQRLARPDKANSHRRRPLHVLFVHRDAEVIDSCLQALEKAQFTVNSDFVLNLSQCAEQLPLQQYDVIVVEYPNPASEESQVLQLLHQSVQQTPLIFLTSGSGSESIAQLGCEGSFEFAEQEHPAQLPMAIRRVLKEKGLRDELEDARSALRHSQSLYRALADNPTYGICRLNAEGELADVNLTLARMLGYSSKDELLTADREAQFISNLRKGFLFAVPIAETLQIDPSEIEWQRKDGKALKVRLSGRGVYDDHGNFAGYEIIAVDVTEQRTLEDQLRREASSDSLTGLANHRRLFEVLHAEICRSKRTGREFSLLLLDLDGLKRINDQFGHVVGSRALCRLAQIVADCCRSVDTAARHGGDEFALVLPETGIGAATLVGQRICDLLGKDAEEPALSVSVGAAAYPGDAETIGTLLYAADRALYVMKENQSGNGLKVSR